MLITPAGSLFGFQASSERASAMDVGAEMDDEDVLCAHVRKTFALNLILLINQDYLDVIR